MSEIDFEEDWTDVAKANWPPIRLTKASTLLGSLETACQEAAIDFRVSFQEFAGQTVSTDLLGKMIAKAVPLFMARWVESLKGYNLAGLIEVILDGQDLEPDEMKGFIRAIPRSVISRICDSEVGTWTGVHALMGVENAWRRGQLQEDYILARDPGSGNRIFFEFKPSNRPNPSENGKGVRFYLDEERGEGLPSV